MALLELPADFAEKAERALGLYRHKSADGVVVCFDEMGPIQPIPQPAWLHTLDRPSRSSRSASCGPCAAGAGTRPWLRMPGEDTNRGATAARDARTALGLDPDLPLACVLTVVETLARVPVVLASLPEGFAGAYLKRGGRPLIFVALDGAVARRRFSLAHELGHHYLDHPRQATTWAGMRIGERHPHETQANAFAAEFLAPKKGIISYISELGDPPVTLDLVVRLAARFGTSCEAMRYRLWTCELVTDEQLAAQLDDELRADQHTALAAQFGVQWPQDLLADLQDAQLRLPEGFEGAHDAIMSLLATG